jgi:large subunit ribosomal protein L25
MSLMGVFSVAVQLQDELADAVVDQRDEAGEHVLYALTISAKPADIPNEITVDITGLSIGDAIRVGDLDLPAGATTDVDPEETVVSASMAQSAEASPAEGDEGEGAEGDAEGQADGDAGADDGDGDAAAGEDS